MRSAVSLLLALVACSQPAGPPHGPKYIPVNSPEAESPCPEKWRAAKEAREALVGQSSAEGRARAAGAVLVQGECELRAFQKRPMRADDEDGMLRYFRQLRDHFQDVKNLLEEVMNYESARYNVGALARLGDLHRAYAAKLRASPAPLDIRDSNRKRAYRQELGVLARALDEEAEVAYRAALQARASVAGADQEVQDWTSDACQGLERLDPGAYRRESLCLRGLSR